MRVHHNVCCGIDVHKKSVTACLMWGPADKEPQFEIRRFGTMTRDLQKLAEWLKQAGCEAATMESTGSYWKPVWNVLEGQIPKLILANAQHVRALPGEKTDRKDGKRLAELTRYGQVRPSYVPPRAILELRDLTDTGASCCRRAAVNGTGFRKYWKMPISNSVRSCRMCSGCLDKR